MAFRESTKYTLKNMQIDVWIFTILKMKQEPTPIAWG